MSKGLIFCSKNVDCSSVNGGSAAWHSNEKPHASTHRLHNKFRFMSLIVICNERNCQCIPLMPRRGTAAEYWLVVYLKSIKGRRLPDNLNYLIMLKRLFPHFKMGISSHMGLPVEFSLHSNHTKV